MLTLYRSKINHFGQQTELIGLPRADRAPGPDRCPLTALDTRYDLTGITTGPVLRKVSPGDRVPDRPQHPESVT